MTLKAIHMIISMVLSKERYKIILSLWQQAARST